MFIVSLRAIIARLVAGWPILRAYASVIAQLAISIRILPAYLLMLDHMGRATAVVAEFAAKLRPGLDQPHMVLKPWKVLVGLFRSWFW